jgi:hypothetical protein
VWLNTGLLFLVAGVGAIEGYCFNATGIARDPAVMSEQMNKFRLNVVMRLFAAALGSSMLFQAAQEYLMPSFVVETMGSRYGRAGLAKTIIGSGLAGVGVALGAGATMTPSMLGAGVKSAPTALAGFAAGATIYWILDQKLSLIPHLPEVDPDKEKITINERMGKRYWRMAAPIGALLVGAAYAAERLPLPGFDPAEEQRRLRPSIGPITLSPVVTGLVIGANQVVLRLVAHAGQGGSSSVSTLLSLLTFGIVAPGNWPKSFQPLFQPAFVYGGTMLGSWYAMRANSDFKAAAGPAEPWKAFLGGVCAVLGGKIAHGCVCGRSITAASELAPEGWIAACVTFGCGLIAGSFLL